ncbi:MAG: hypothetical protein FWC20_09575 [Oscillospiraceae bacterium]|nr:hypothetical protein [Oscillospiraceae bacterium]MCL2279639.1 hypothetical protein [Oscillospiraceae bacterium]
MEKESKLFRKSALDKISSPEQLNEYMKVAGPGVWAILAGLAVTFAAFFIWGFMGSIPETAEFGGTVIIPGDYPMAIFAYLPIEEIRQFSEGKQARIVLDYTPTEQFGYIRGTVYYIGDTPVTLEGLKEFHGEDFPLLTLPPGNVIEVIIALDNIDGQLVWSKPTGMDIEVIEGSSAHVTVIVAERRPYELIFR